MNTAEELETTNHQLEQESSQEKESPRQKNKIKNLLAFWKSKLSPRLVLLFVLILVNVVLWSVYFDVFGTRSNQTINTQIAQQRDYFNRSLQVVSSGIEKGSFPSEFNIKFNHPVDIHSLDHAVTFYPNVTGKWEAVGADAIEFKYKFDKKFKGTYLSIQINNTLMSLDGTRLADGFRQSYDISENDEFASNSRIRTFAFGQPISYPYTEDEAIVYKSTAHNLLDFLKYKLPEKIERGNLYDGEYINNHIAHSDAQKLTNLKIDTEKNTIELDTGIYFIDDNTNEPYFIIVNKVGAVLRQDDKNVLVGAFDLNTGAKLEGSVQFDLYNLNNSVKKLNSFTYSENNNTVALAYPQRLDAVIGNYNGEEFFIPVEVRYSAADIKVSADLDKQTSIFLYTDRPIYKPGDTVFVKGIVKIDSDSLYKIPPQGTNVYVKLDDNFNNSLKPAEPIVVTTNEFGAFSTNFVLPEDYVDEYANVLASTEPFSEDNYYYNSANFSVMKYTKPEFEIKTSVEKSEYLQSEKLTFNISGNYFDGKPLANALIHYELYSDVYYEVEKAVYNENFNISSGGMCGGGGFGDYFGRLYDTRTVTLDNSGKAQIQTDWDKKSVDSQKITLVAKIVDQNSNELISASNTIVHASEFNIFFIPSAEKYSEGEELVAPFYAENLAGEKIANKEFSHKLVRYNYNNSSDEIKETILLEGKTQTDENGKGIVRFLVPNDVKNEGLKLVITGTDSKNNIALKQKDITVVDKDSKTSVYNSYWGSGISQTYLKIQSNQNSFVVGDTVKLNINSPKDLDVLFSLERGRIYKKEYLHLQKGDNTFEFVITPELSPSITAVFSFFSEGNYYTEGLSLNVPAMHKLLNIGLYLDKQQYTIADKNALLNISAKDADGYPVVAQMSVGIVDKAIYALRESATPKIHTDYYYFRARRTNASSSLTGLSPFEGGGGGGGGGSELGSAADVLYWNPDLRTDSDGNASVSIPLLGQQTIWKVQVIGTTSDSKVGQQDVEFMVTK